MPEPRALSAVVVEVTATAQVLPCRSSERFRHLHDEHTDMSCCKASQIYMAGPHHAGPCCADPNCNDCDPMLLRERVIADRDALLAAVARIYGNTLDSFSREVAGEALALAEGR